MPVKKKITSDEANVEITNEGKTNEKKSATKTVKKSATAKTATTKTATAKSASAKSASAKPTPKVKKVKIIETPVPKVEDTDLKEINCIANAMLDKKASAVCSLDLRPTGTAICEYFVICDAASTTQVIAIADNVEEMMHKECNRKIIRMQGKENAFWIIIDYGYIVVHIFQTEYRQFYRLEDLWGDAQKTIYQD